MKFIRTAITVLVSMFILALDSCEPVLKDTFTSKKLVSSKGESIFINSLNWGVTDDHQLSSISKSEKKLRERTDSALTIKGLNPFLYSFKNDSLNLFFNGEVTYAVADSFSTITITYNSLSRGEMAKLLHIAMRNDGYHMVPARP